MVLRDEVNLGYRLFCAFSGTHQNLYECHSVKETGDQEGWVSPIYNADYACEMCC